VICVQSNVHHLMLKRNKLSYLVTRESKIFLFFVKSVYAVAQLVQAIPNGVIGIFL